MEGHCGEELHPATRPLHCIWDRGRLKVADFSRNKLWLPPQAGCPPSRRTVSVLRRLPYMSVRAGNLLICDRVKPVKEGNTPEEAEWKGSVDLTCAPVPLLWHYLGKRNDFPNNNTLKQHQENDRHMHFTSLFISMLLRVWMKVEDKRCVGLVLRVAQWVSFLLSSTFGRGSVCHAGPQTDHAGCLSRTAPG